MQRPRHITTTTTLLFHTTSVDHHHHQNQIHRNIRQLPHQLSSQTRLRFTLCDDDARSEDTTDNNNTSDLTLTTNVVPHDTTTATTNAAAATTDRTTTTKSTTSPDGWIQIGSTITTDACPLLGIKSLGVDYGLVRTGLAMSVGYEPIPLTIVTTTTSSSSNHHHPNVTELCQTIIQYATTYQVQQIIVGLPLHKNGTIAEQTLLTLNFTQQLAIRVVSQLGPHISILLFDERYTSKMAVAREHVQNPKLARSSQSLYGTLDATAAGIILENYYEDNGIGAHVVTLPNDIRETCIQQYHESQSKIKAEQQRQINTELERRQHRWQLMERAKFMDRQQQQQLLVNGTTTSDTVLGKKRKKKKKK